MDHRNETRDSSPDGRGKIYLDQGVTVITFHRTLLHPIESVWEAITDPAELSAWMLESAEIDARVGGSIRYVSSPTPIVWTGKILAWEPPRLYAHEMHTDADPRWGDHPGSERATARWELEALGPEETLLTVTFRGFTPGTVAGFAPGTHAFLDRLEALLARESLPDWIERFAALRPFYEAQFKEAGL